MKNKKIESIIILIAIPLAISGLLYLITKESKIIEVIFAVFGLIELIVFVSRANRNEKTNMKKTGTYKNDKKSVRYYDYRHIQTIILISAFTNLLLSYLSFVILGA